MRAAVQLLLLVAVWGVCGEKVDVAVGDVKIGEKVVGSGEVAEGLVYTERQRVSVSVPVTAKGKNVESIEQAAIRFTHKTTGKQVWFDLEAKAEDWSVTVDLTRAAESAFDFVGGKYTLSLVVSDSKFKKQVQRHVADMTLDLTATPLYRQRMEFSEMKDWVRKTPQKWDIRPDEERGSAFASLCFSAAFAVPALVLFAMLYNAGIKFSGPSNFASFLRTFVFQGAICAICAVMVLYWIRVPLFPSLLMIGAIGVVAFVFRPKASTPKEKSE